MTLHDRVIQLVEKHGSLRAAARAIQVEVSYLSRLGSGEKDSPSSEVLRRMGLRQITSYELLRPAPLAHTTDGAPCWCEPTVEYLDPDTGVAVIVHKEMQ